MVEVKSTKSFLECGGPDRAGVQLSKVWIPDIVKTTAADENHKQLLGRYHGKEARHIVQAIFFPAGVEKKRSVISGLLDLGIGTQKRCDVSLPARLLPYIPMVHFNTAETSIVIGQKSRYG